MTTKRRKFTNKFKASVAFAAIKEQKMLAELSKEFEVSPNRIERFWRTIKRECIYLNPCDNAIELQKGIEKFMLYYNTERHHQGIDNEIPARKYENNKLLIRTPGQTHQICNSCIK